MRVSATTVVTAVILACVLAIPAFAAPQIQSLGAEEAMPGYSGRLPSIAVDTKDQPHIAADSAGSGWMYFYDKINGAWRFDSYNSGGAQFYYPQLEINNFDQAWVSGIKWYPQGMGLVLRGNMSTSPTFLRYTGTTAGYVGLPIGSVSLDPEINNEAIVWAGNGGYYERVLWNGSSFVSGGTGSLGTGPGGEKNSFFVSKAGQIMHPNGVEQAVWHSASDWSYNNSVRAYAGKGAVSWAESAMDDGAYPRIVSDNVEPQTAYLFADYGDYSSGLYMNIWKASNASGDGNFVSAWG